MLQNVSPKDNFSCQNHENAKWHEKYEDDFLCCI
jgi:hypothetical protein